MKGFIQSRHHCSIICFKALWQIAIPDLLRVKKNIVRSSSFKEGVKIFVAMPGSRRFSLTQGHGFIAPLITISVRPPTRNYRCLMVRSNLVQAALTLTIVAVGGVAAPCQGKEAIRCATTRTFQFHQVPHHLLATLVKAFPFTHVQKVNWLNWLNNPKKKRKEMSYFRRFEWSYFFQAPSSFNQIYIHIYSRHA